MLSDTAIVFVIDDDEAVRKSVQRLLDTARYEVELLSLLPSFSRGPCMPGLHALVVDIKMPGLSGIDLQKALIERGREEQIVFVTGHGDVPMCAQAMKAGFSLKAIQA